MNNKLDLLYKLRRDYSGMPLLEKKMPNDPMHFFEQWMHEAIESGINDPNAFTISTVTPEGRPASRIVLLRQSTADGLVFFTNYNSHKGKELAENPFGAMNFFWKELMRQVRIEGHLVKISKEESSAYFSSRPRESQIGAWASEQSKVLKNRVVLEKKFAELTKKFKGNPVPCPPHWGGYRIVPNMFEFWQGRENRLHDRMVYTRKSKGWSLKRLSP